LDLLSAFQLFLGDLCATHDYDTYDENSPTPYAVDALYGESYGDRTGVHVIEPYAHQQADLYRDLRDCICLDSYSYNQCDEGGEKDGCERRRVHAEVIESFAEEGGTFLSTSMRLEFSCIITSAGFGLVQQRYPLNLQRPMYFVHFSSS